MQRSKFRSNLKAIRDNVDYVLKEVKDGRISADGRKRTEAVFNEFSEFLDRLNTHVSCVDSDLHKFLDRPNAQLAKAIQDALAPIDWKLLLFKMHELVQSLKNDGLVFILVAESATNILSAEGSVTESANKIKESVAQAAEACAEFNGELESLALTCSMCGNEDCVSFCVVAADSAHPFYSLTNAAGTGILVVNHGESMLRLNAPRFDSARVAIRNQDSGVLLKMLDTPYPYCESCSLPYCEHHWGAPDVVFDEGYYDCTYATCPKGHRIMIDD
ncbi:MAG TPA: hypothetical protein V6C81_24790 [Planktothrix sp.]